MDGDFRSQAAWMPPWLRPDRPETPIYILLVKSDFERRLKKRWCAVLPYAALPLLHPSLAYAAPSILPMAV